MVHPPALELESGLSLDMRLKTASHHPAIDTDKRNLVLEIRPASITQGIQTDAQPPINPAKAFIGDYPFTNPAPVCGDDLPDMRSGSDLRFQAFEVPT